MIDFSEPISYSGIVEPPLEEPVEEGQLPHV